MAFSVSSAREHFPALQQNPVFMDNAGGSQILKEVVTSIHDYLLNTNVQLGATYNTSQTSTTKVGQGYQAAADYVNASRDEIVIASSTTQAFRNLATSLDIAAGSEIILSKCDHETNIDAWLDMAKSKNLTVKWWSGDTSSPTNPRLTPDSLRPLLSPKTALVAFTHCSNLLGGIHDVKAIADLVHETPGALCVVDGVAYAPHRRIDVQKLGVDFYAFSWYKVYGPHTSLLFGAKRALDRVKSQGHFFNPHQSLQNKLELAGSSYELVQSLPQIVEYLGGAKALDASFEEIAKHEEGLMKILLGFLTSRQNVVVYGDPTPNREVRVPTVSFTVKGRKSKEIVDAVEQKSSFGFRNGHMFSQRLVTEILGLPEADGVVRISLVHYNSEKEVKELVQVLEQVIG